MFSKDEKLQLLRKEFQMSAQDMNQLRDQKIILQYLDNKSEQPFDRDVFNQIIERITGGENHPISVEQFVQVWLEAEEILRQKIEVITSTISEYNNQKIMLFQKYNQAKSQEQTNEYSIMHGSQLIITIKHGEGQWQNQNIQILLTRAIKGNSISWNESFSFDVTTGQEQLVFSVQNQNQQNLGQVFGDLKQLKDQQEHSEQLQINGQGGFVQIEIQWIWSKAQQYKDLLELADEKNSQEINDLNDYKADFESLHLPFSLRQQIQQKQKIQQVGSPKRGNQLQQSLGQSSEVDYVFMRYRFLQKDEYLYLRLLLLLLMVVDLFISFSKTTFLDIMIITVILFMWEQNKIDQNRIKYFILALSLSLINDIIWLAIWFHGTFQFSFTGDSIMQFVCISMIFLVFIKVFQFLTKNYIFV